MSVVEIKAALRSLSAAELADVEQLAADLRRNPAQPAPQVREVKSSDPDFIAAKKKVFEEHRELFRRLAE